jgi:hemerythrin-like domain-containing protein
MDRNPAIRALTVAVPVAVAGATGVAIWALRRRGSTPDDGAPTDVGFMRAMHAALRRDLSRLEATAPNLDAEGRVPPDVRAAWARFQHALERHHSAEDDDLWPVLRRHLVMSEEQQVVDRMVEEHDALTAAISATDVALATGGNVTDAVGELGSLLRRHLEHEEQSALPLLELHLSRDEWRHFLHTERRRTPVRERPEFLSWVLADAAEPDAAAVLAEIPPPGRLVYRKVLAPRYAARHRSPTQAALS